MTDTLAAGQPEGAGFHHDLPRRVDQTVTAQLKASRIPGAVVLVARRGTITHDGSYGCAQDHDEFGPLVTPRPMTSETIFDIGSVSKVVVTTAVAMHLLDRGTIRLDDPVEQHLSRPGRLKGRGVRIHHLLEHRAGLPPWQPLYLWTSCRDDALRRIGELETAAVGAVRVYSDLGMMLMGAICENAADASLTDLIEKAVTRPLWLIDTVFLPAARQRSRCAATSTGNPTEQRMIATNDPIPVDAQPRDFPGWRERTLVGDVNDGNAAYAFGGVAGHAGLFSTARDLAVLGQTLLQDGRYGGTQVWDPSTVDAFTRPGTNPNQGMGFWRRRLAAYGTDDGDARSYGHRGFPGCELIVDPTRQLVIVMLSNRLHTEADPPTDDAPLWRGVVRAVISSLAA